MIGRHRAVLDPRLHAVAVCVTVSGSHSRMSHHFGEEWALDYPVSNLDFQNDMHSRTSSLPEPILEQSTFSCGIRDQSFYVARVARFANDLGLVRPGFGPLS